MWKLVGGDWLEQKDAKVTRVDFDASKPDHMWVNIGCYDNPHLVPTAILFDPNWERYLVTKQTFDHACRHKAAVELIVPSLDDHGRA